MINGPTWTLSGMLIVEFIILNILVRYEKSFFRFWAPLAILLGCGFWANLSDVNHFLWRGFTTFGVIRILISTCLGMYAWESAKWFMNVKFSKKGTFALTIIELACHVIAVLTMVYSGSKFYRMLCALLFALATAITLSRKSYTAEWFSGKHISSISRFLGEWSMAIYISHMPIQQFLFRYFETPYEFYRIKYVYGIVIIIVSLMFLFLGRWINHVTPKISEKLRSIFIENENYSEIQ